MIDTFVVCSLLFIKSLSLNLSRRKGRVFYDLDELTNLFQSILFEKVSRWPLALYRCILELLSSFEDFQVLFFSNLSNLKLRDGRSATLRPLHTLRYINRHLGSHEISRQFQFISAFFSIDRYPQHVFQNMGLFSN